MLADGTEKCEKLPLIQCASAAAVVASILSFRPAVSARLSSPRLLLALLASSGEEQKNQQDQPAKRQPVTPPGQSRGGLFSRPLFFPFPRPGWMP